MANDRAFYVPVCRRLCMCESFAMYCHLLGPTSSSELLKNEGSALQSKIGTNVRGYAALDTGATNQIWMRHLYVYVFFCALIEG